MGIKNNFKTKRGQLPYNVKFMNVEKEKKIIVV